MNVGIDTLDSVGLLETLNVKLEYGNGKVSKFDEEKFDFQSWEELEARRIDTDARERGASQARVNYIILFFYGSGAKSKN